MKYILLLVLSLALVNAKLHRKHQASHTIAHKSHAKLVDGECVNTNTNLNVRSTASSADNSNIVYTLKPPGIMRVVSNANDQWVRVEVIGQKNRDGAPLQGFSSKAFLHSVQCPHEFMCVIEGTVDVKSAPNVISTTLFTANTDDYLYKGPVVNGYMTVTKIPFVSGYAPAALLKDCYPTPAVGPTIDTSMAPVASSTGSPCFPASDTRTDREKLMDAANAIITRAAEQTYTQGGFVNAENPGRWCGIKLKVCPPQVPKWSDCSSSSTWVYWTVFGNGPDFLNGQNWGAGYTGTLVEHGEVIDLEDAQPGDLVFYGDLATGKVKHVSIYAGDSMTISHGSDPPKRVGIDSYGRTLKRLKIVKYIP